MFLENELRLIWVLLLNAAVVGAAFRFARRWGGGGRLQAACDALLALFAVEYLAVALPGVASVFNAGTMSFVAIVAAGLLFHFGKSAKHSTAEVTGKPLSSRSRLLISGAFFDSDRRDRLGFIASFLFVVGYSAAYGYDQRWLPPLSTDPLVYHLPTAVQWIQTGRLGLFPAWYWNPAASYSPATSSTFMAWLMAPIGNDALVRYVQLPPLLLIFFVVARLCRLGGCSRGVAGAIAASAALCRPFFSEAVFAKDDLFITAFFGCAVVAAARENLCNRLSPWRAGLALGMVLASKYTVLMACPLFLFLLDAPLSAKWRLRNWVIAVGMALSLSMPWYLRNIWLTGNPIYPVDVKFLHLRGMFTTERDQSLRTAGGIWNMLSATYHSLPLPLIAALVAGWIAAIARSRRKAWTDPIERAALIGTPVTIALFLVASPHHEVRYIFPFVMLLFGVLGWAIHRWLRPEWLRGAIAAVALLVAIVTGFEWDLVVSRSLLFCIEGVGLMGAGLLIILVFWYLDHRSHTSALRFARALKMVALAILLLAIYAFWQPSYLRLYADTDIVGASWDQRYPKHADLWRFVRDTIPPDSTIAFANTSLIYPLYDFDYRRRVVYAPIRKGLFRFLDVPRLGDTLPGDSLVDAMTAVQDANPDRETWMKNLRCLHAEFLLVHKAELSVDAPELRFAAANPRQFRRIYESDNGFVFQLTDAPDDDGSDR